MDLVFKQFQTREDPRKQELVEIEMVKPNFGPIVEGKVGSARILVVDDQIFNIEYLRCQLELIPSVKGHCDYVTSGLSAVQQV